MHQEVPPVVSFKVRVPPRDHDHLLPCRPAGFRQHRITDPPTTTTHQGLHSGNDLRCQQTNPHHHHQNLRRTHNFCRISSPASHRMSRRPYHRPPQHRNLRSTSQTTGNTRAKSGAVFLKRSKRRSMRPLWVHNFVERAQVANRISSLHMSWLSQLITVRSLRRMT